MYRTVRRSRFFLGLVSFLLARGASAQAVVQQTRDPALLPTPESVLGFPVGADFKLATYDESIRYFQRLAARRERLKLMEVGRTPEGRPWFLALISSPENLARLDHYREIAQRLAH